MKWNPYIADVDGVCLCQQDLWCIWHDMDGFLVVVPGSSVQALKGQNNTPFTYFWF